MTQFDLAGKGGPIPTVALPSPGEDANFPPQVFQLENGSVWEKEDYVGLGYTHYEVWCVGAAGGLGSNLMNRFVYYKSTIEKKVMPGSYPHGDLWGAYCRVQEIWYEQHGYTPPWDNPNSSVHNVNEYANVFNPLHQFNTWIFEPTLSHTIDNSAAGGGGGGGGVHVVRGTLADLPNSSEVIVGQAGPDGPTAQTVVNAAWLPPQPVATWNWLRGWANEPLPPFFNDEDAYLTLGLQAWMRNYFDPGDVYIPPPQAGSDGGYSSFADVCHASGGKGGNPAKIWVGTQLVIDGDGGAGGVGDRVEAGGGGSGSANLPVAGHDGTWDQSAIGQGGGGGHSGIPSGARYELLTGNRIPGSEYPAKPATNGGRGSFSYADTSIYGNGQARSIQNGEPIVPGGGGGAKADKKFKYGSKAIGFNPNGLVFLRVYKVDD